MPKQVEAKRDGVINPLRTYNDKAYTSPQLFGQFFNCEVKKPSKF